MYFSRAPSRDSELPRFSDETSVALDSPCCHSSRIVGIPTSSLGSFSSWRYFGWTRDSASVSLPCLGSGPLLVSVHHSDHYHRVVVDSFGRLFRGVSYCSSPFFCFTISCTVLRLFCTYFGAYLLVPRVQFRRTISFCFSPVKGKNSVLVLGILFFCFPPHFCRFCLVDILTLLFLDFPFFFSRKCHIILKVHCVSVFCTNGSKIRNSKY